MSTGNTEAIRTRTSYNNSMDQPGRGVASANSVRMSDDSVSLIAPQTTQSQTAEGGTFAQLNQGIQPGISPGSMNIGTSGNLSGMMETGAEGASGNMSPGRLLMEEAQSTQKEIQTLSREGAGTSENNTLNWLRNSLSGVSQIARGADTSLKQSQQLSKQSKKLSKASDKMQEAGEIQDKKGIALIATGSAMIAAGTALLCNPATMGKGAALIAAGAMLVKSGEEARKAAKKLKAMAKKLKKKSKEVAKQAKQMMDNVRKSMMTGQEKIQMTRSKMPKIRTAIKQKSKKHTIPGGKLRSIIGQSPQQMAGISPARRITSPENSTNEGSALSMLG